MTPLLLLSRSAFHVPQASTWTKVIVCAVLLAWGLSCIWLFFRPTRKTRSEMGFARPWRRVGAAICGLLAVMFVLGVALVDIPDHPRAYAAYWIVMLCMVAWLCVLATKDVVFTIKLQSKAREERKQSLIAELEKGAREHDS